MSRTAEFDKLFNEHRRPVHAYLLGRSGDPDLAADLLQETFLKVWKRLDSVLTICAEERRYYILSMARSVAADSFRRHRPIETSISTIMEVPCPREDSTDLAALDAAIMKLPEDLRTILTMHVLGDMTSAEVSLTLNRPAGTVRYQLHEARKRLAKILGIGGEE